MNRDAIINALIQYVEGGWQDMKLGSSFWALFMFIHIQMNVILSTTGPILLPGPSELDLQNHKHSPPPFSTLQRGLWMEDELRLVGCFLQEVLGIKELFVIVVKHDNVQEMTCGFIHAITVALTQQSVKEYTADNRELCFTDHGRNLCQIGGRTPTDFRRVRISLLGSEVLSILSCHQVNSWRKEVTQPLQNWILYP